jgi:FlaA1/EpsC-like NDP-sugar epimerase
VKVVDLARDIIALSGLREGEDIEIQFSGVRPGEKLFEELSLAEEGAVRTRHPKVFIGRIKPHAWDDVLRHVGDLQSAARDADAERIRELFGRMVPEYKPSQNVPSAPPRSEPAPAPERRTPQPVVIAESG